jgi:hypothetical protein
MNRTERNPALAAPARLRPGGYCIELLVDLFKIGTAFRHGPFFRRFLWQMYKLQHRIGHFVASSRHKIRRAATPRAILQPRLNLTFPQAPVLFLYLGHASCRKLATDTVRNLESA